MLEQFKRTLREYCWDIGNLPSNEDVLLDEAKRTAKIRTQASFSEALQKAVDARPQLTEPRSLATEPSDVLFNLYEKAGDFLAATMTKVQGEHPELVELDRLYQNDPYLFEKACKRVGSLSGEHRATENDVIAKVLFWAGELRKEQEATDETIRAAIEGGE